MRSIFLFFGLIISFTTMSQSLRLSGEKIESKAIGVPQIVHESEQNIYMQVKDIVKNYIICIDKKTLSQKGSIIIKREDYSFFEDNLVFTKLNLIKKNCGVTITLHNFKSGKSKEAFFSCPENIDFKWYSNSRISSSKNGKFHLFRMYANDKLGGKMYNLLLDNELNEVKSFVTTFEKGVSIDVTIDDDGSVYFLTDKLNLICYNALKDYEVWEQNIDTEHKLLNDGYFYGIKAEMIDKKLEYTTQYQTENKEFQIKIPINYYTKEAGEFKVKEVQKIELEDNDYVYNDYGTTTIINFQKVTKKRPVGANREERSLKMSFCDDDRKIVSKQSYFQVSNDVTWYSGFGIEMDSNHVDLVFNVSEAEFENLSNLKSVKNKRNIILENKVLQAAPIATLIQRFDRLSGECEFIQLVFDSEDRKKFKVKIDPKTYTKSVFSKDSYIVGYKVAQTMRSSYPIPMSFVIFKISEIK